MITNRVYRWRGILYSLVKNKNYKLGLVVIFTITLDVHKKDKVILAIIAVFKYNYNLVIA